MSEAWSRRSENSMHSNGRPCCIHGPCQLLRSFTTDNPGRRFWRCPVWDELFLNIQIQTGGCRYFQWFEDPYEGRVREAFVHFIRKRQIAEEKEKMNAAAKLKSLHEGYEAKLKKIRTENRLLKQSLMHMKCRLTSLYFLIIFSLLILLVWICVEKNQFVESRRRLPK